MSDLNFNIYAFARPQTKAEYSALLDEAVRIGEQLEAAIDEMSTWLKKNVPARVRG